MAHAIYAGLREIARAAWVAGTHVHPHAFCQTIVGQLLEPGNSMEVRCKYLGHVRVSTTSASYWIPSIVDIRTQMNKLFAGSLQRQVENEDVSRERADELELKLDAAFHLLHQQTSTFRAAAAQGMSARDAFALFAEHVPQAAELFRGIVESSGTSKVDVEDPATSRADPKKRSSGGAPKEESSIEDVTTEQVAEIRTAGRTRRELGLGSSSRKRKR